MIQRIFPLGAGFLMALGAAGCCMGGATPTPITPPMPSVAPAVAPAVAPPGMPPAATTALTIGAGFAPDPNIISTFAGGPVPGSTMSTGDVYCGGNHPLVPNVTLTTSTPIAGLRVVVRGTTGADPVLAVRLSDGRVFCDDDGGGYPNPAVTMDVPAGVHQVYVGSFRANETLPATVAFTTNPALTFEALP
jgi:hypothetical protein